MLLMTHKNGYLAGDINDLRLVDDIYGGLNNGDFDAILTELHKYEYYESVNNSKSNIKKLNFTTHSVLI